MFFVFDWFEIFISAQNECSNEKKQKPNPSKKSSQNAGLDTPVRHEANAIKAEAAMERQSLNLYSPLFFVSYNGIRTYTFQLIIVMSISFFQIMQKNK